MRPHRGCRPRPRGPRAALGVLALRALVSLVFPPCGGMLPECDGTCAPQHRAAMGGPDAHSLLCAHGAVSDQRGLFGLSSVVVLTLRAAPVDGVERVAQEAPCERTA